MSMRERGFIPLWPLPLAAALLLLVATHLALWLSIQAGYVPACVPYWEGCTSISRAARHGLGNHLFRLLVIPCAVLHGASWWVAGRWLRDDEGRASRWWMLVLGLFSASALAIYATFLGTEGEVYGFLRRYGVTVYFGFGFLAQLLLMRWARALRRMSPALLKAMAVLCVAMLGLGVGNVVASALVADDSLRDRVENALEWQLGLLLVGWHLLLARGWWRARFGLRLYREGEPL
ncbi:hypothetical protein [Pseudoxanthomonas sp. z9]|uniref:hypothetical protein n=1 Tax=Pseudoxanthomonas sp. z9 TaxID=2584942 RepID=UPI001143D17D|nr:hypothetical protein [Pseudoxanthomonas sp. z9]